MKKYQSIEGEKLQCARIKIAKAKRASRKCSNNTNCERGKERRKKKYINKYARRNHNEKGHNAIFI